MTKYGSRSAWACKTLLCLALCGALLAHGQEPQPAAASVTGRVDLPRPAASAHKPAVVVWLSPVKRSSALPPVRPGRFTLVQKNRMFSPHLLVIPVGSTVAFPNEDPFFHNVFSLFNGKRFDLGLYEAGSSKQVVFSREGVSYIFCNIHPEMSAVVISLSTSLYAVPDPSGHFTVHQVPAGDYDVHVWIEGIPQPALDKLSRRVHLRTGESANLNLDASAAPRSPSEHLNKFGRPYDRDTQSPY